MNLQRVFQIMGGASSSIVLLIGLNGCSTNTPAPTSRANPEMPVSSSFTSSAVCANNPFLQKYRCSFVQVEQAARSGDPDAQYALGYLYYYGIGTTQDRQTGLLWIRKAAAQGQTVAQEALGDLSAKSSSPSPANSAPKRAVSSAPNSGGSAPTQVNNPGSNSSSATTTPAASPAPAAKPDKPLTDYLPNYGEKRVDTTSTPPMINLSTPPASQN